MQNAYFRANMSVVVIARFEGVSSQYLSAMASIIWRGVQKFRNWHAIYRIPRLRPAGR